MTSINVVHGSDDRHASSCRSRAAHTFLSKFLVTSMTTISRCLRYSHASSATYLSTTEGRSSATRKPKSTGRRPANRFGASRVNHVDTSSAESTTSEDTSSRAIVWGCKPLLPSKWLFRAHESAMPTVRKFRISVCEQSALRGDATVI